jgi:hypothetical protein
MMVRKLPLPSEQRHLFYQVDERICITTLSHATGIFSWNDQSTAPRSVNNKFPAKYVHPPPDDGVLSRIYRHKSHTYNVNQLM